MWGVRWLLRNACRVAVHRTLHNSPRHSEITALCRLWLCAAATLDVKQMDSSYLYCCCAQRIYLAPYTLLLHCIVLTGWITARSMTDRRSFIRSDRFPIYVDRCRFRTSTKIGAFLQPSLANYSIRLQPC